MLTLLFSLAHRLGLLDGGPTGRRKILCAAASILLLLAGGFTASRAASSPEPATIVFSARGDLWLYSSTTRKSRRLTTDGREHPDSNPSFVDADTIAFVRDGDLVRLALGTRNIEMVARGPVLAYAWNHQSDRLAVLVQPNGVGKHLLYISRPLRRERTLIRRFAITDERPGDGSTPTPDAERSLAWSPSGALLLVDTDLASPEKPIHVLDLRGRDLITPLVGTHAGWLGDSIYYRSLTRTRWRLTNARDGRTATLPIRQGRMHPSLSPDGRLLALDDGRAWNPGRPRRGCTCTVFVYDFRRRLEYRVRRGIVAPVWLSPSMLAATEVRTCSGAECGVDVPMWVPTGSGSLVGLNGMATRARGLSTLEAASHPKPR